MKGIVTPSNEPCVTIKLRSRHSVKKVQTIIDTGFNGYLAVPNQLVRKLKWKLIGSEKYEVATGELEVFDVYLGSMGWNKKWMPVYALVTRGEDILMGTKLLKDSRLLVDFPKRKVLIS